MPNLQGLNEECEMYMLLDLVYGFTKIFLDTPAQNRVFHMSGMYYCNRFIFKFKTYVKTFTLYQDPIGWAFAILLGTIFSATTAIVS